MIELSDENFDAEVLNKEETVVVDFYADWCGPCKVLAPILDSVAKDYPLIKICKLNIENAQEIARRFKVTSIPFIAVFKDGKIVDRRIGFNGRPAIEDLFERNQ